MKLAGPPSGGDCLDHISFSTVFSAAATPSVFHCWRCSRPRLRLNVVCDVPYSVTFWSCSSNTLSFKLNIVERWFWTLSAIVTALTFHWDAVHSFTEVSWLLSQLSSSLSGWKDEEGNASWHLWNFCFTTPSTRPVSNHLASWVTNEEHVVIIRWTMIDEWCRLLHWPYLFAVVIWYQLLHLWTVFQTDFDFKRPRL